MSTDDLAPAALSRAGLRPAPLTPVPSPARGEGDASRPRRRDGGERVRAKLTALFALAASFALAACDGLVTRDDRAVFVLVDVSGTYFSELEDSIRGAKLLASSLGAGDRLAVAEIGSCSFNDDAIAVDTRLPDRPTAAAAAKAGALVAIDGYAARAARTQNTDIHGALLQAVDRFSRMPASRHVVVIFSDLVEDPAPGCGSAAAPLDLTGVTVIAANVIKLNSDAQAPDAYFARLASWREKVEAAGGAWVLVDDVEALRAATTGA